jgi:hypothetical protein
MTDLEILAWLSEKRATALDDWLTANRALTDSLDMPFADFRRLSIKAAEKWGYYKGVSDSLMELHEKTI